MTKVLKSKYKAIINIEKEPTYRKKKTPPLEHVKKSDWTIVWIINTESSLLLMMNGTD